MSNDMKNVMQIRRAAATATLAALCTVGVAACAPDPGGPPTTTTTTTSTTSTTTSTTSTTSTTIYQAPESGTASTFQIDPQHTGNATDASIVVSTLAPKWSATLPGPASYPVIAQGKVFVAAKTATTLYGTTLHAYDLATGTELWSSELGGSYWSAGVAYGSGRVVAVNGSGVARAFDASTGVIAWQQQMPGQYSFDAPITIVGNRVYVTGSGSGGTMYAVRLDTGGVVWSTAIGNGSKSAPAVDATGVYVSHPCDTNRVSFAGTVVWTSPRACSGGGGKNVTLETAAGRLWTRTVLVPGVSSFVSRLVDTATGSFGAAIPTGSPYAVSGGFGYTVSNGVLVKVDPATGQQVWSMGADGDDTLVGAPIVLNGTVLVGGSSGKAYGIAAGNGARVWTRAIGAAVAPIDEQNVSQPPTGWNVGGGVVAVSTTTGFVVLDN